ncbi:MAG: hypothetical protein QNJ65_18350 [Xenococcaceae cyanobacterium MO_234.B1]|nr:hypothetical protein [Xenococcaceae cyanobacterium MO_234.B1]
MIKSREIQLPITSPVNCFLGSQLSRFPTGKFGGQASPGAERSPTPKKSDI